MGSKNQEVLKRLRGSEYDNRKNYYGCTYPISNYENCPYIGTHSEVTSHLARHIGVCMYKCKVCTKEIFDPIEVYTHKDNSGRTCTAGPQNMAAHVPDRNTCVDWWRLKNVYVMTVTEEDYKYYKAKQAEIMLLESGREQPATPGYEDDLQPSINVAPPSRNRHRSYSRGSEAHSNYQSNSFSANNNVPNWSQKQSSNFRQRQQSSTRYSMPDTAHPNSNPPSYRNRQMGKSPGPSNFQPRFSGAQQSGPSSSYRRSFTPLNRSFAHNSRYDGQNEQSIPSKVPRNDSQPRSGWRRSPSPDILDVTPTKRTNGERARCPIPPVRESTSTAAQFRRGRDASQISTNEQGGGLVSLAIQRPREMTRNRRSSVNYRSPAPPEYSHTGRDLQEIARNQQRFQVEQRGTARVVPNRNRMAALLDPSLEDPYWNPPESETVRKRRLEKQQKSRALGSANAAVPLPSQNVRQDTSTQANTSPAPVPPPNLISHQPSTSSGFRRSPPSDNDAPRQ